MQDRKLLDDFAFFSRAHLESGDIDPVYPVLSELQRGMDQDEALWHSLVYVAFYDIASAEHWLRGYDSPAEQWTEEAAYLPTGVERRSLRGGTNMIRHLESLDDVLELHGGSPHRWITHRFTGDPEEDWAKAQETLREPWGNGRWAAYKLVEVLMRVNGLPLVPADMGNAGSTGPRKGLELLWGREADGAAQLDEWGLELQGVLHDRYALTLDLAHLETCLCDFHSMAKGRYYVGHDIDHMQDQILEHPHLDSTGKARLMGARKRALREEYLGELGGWDGLDKERNKLYQKEGRIAVRH